MAKLEYITFEDKQCPPDWRVEAFDTKTGESYIAIFSGPEAEKRAAEYLAFKSGKLSDLTAPAIVVPVPVVTSVRADAFKIKTTNGHDLVIRPTSLDWTYDVRRRLLKAEPKAPIEILKEGV
jgi:hypothetical protein